VVRVSSVGLALLLALSASAQTPPTPAQSGTQSDQQARLVSKVIGNHNGGLVTYYSGNRLKDDEVTLQVQEGVRLRMLRSSITGLRKVGEKPAEKPAEKSSDSPKDVKAS